ncbi:malto-oligosyltrehalose trehalohydrolase [Azospirillum sp.]|uniref:malto-oligosyltrehalose trehalohydrolase n=1 Tax=Azospirillum sp. TaxID=34012 RepID=UPI003D7216E3
MPAATSPNAQPAALPADALRHLEDEVLPDYIAARRWYAAKGAGRPRVQVVDAVPLGGAQLCILRVQPPNRPPQLYLLPLVVERGEVAGDSFRIAGPGDGPWGGTVRDGFGDDRVVRALLDGVRDGGSDGRLRFGRTAALAGVALDGPLHRPGAEQSNTSIRIGDAAILKGFRKLEAGTHPELEVGRFLTEVAGYANTPPLLGWVEVAAGEEASMAAAVLQALVPDAADAWAHVTGRLADRLRRFDDSDAESDRALFALMHRLGQRTAELHRAFAAPTDDPAFRAEPADDPVLASWAEDVRRMAHHALDALRGALPLLDGALAAQARTLLACEPALLAQIDTLLPKASGLQRTRLHGDFHLGQVLVSGDDVFIIDFEGEPMRPLAERRGKHSPLRDAAGMLRSIAYAAATARRGLPGDLDEPARAARDSWLAWWEAEAGGAFIDGYRAAIGDCPSFPADGEAAAGLLKLFLLEKALYEVGYELANRPDWLPIPLGGVLGILGADAGPEVADHVGTRAAEQLGEVRRHPMPFGAEVLGDGTVRFRLWAPGVESVSLWLDTAAELLPMLRQGAGWFEWTTAQAQAGTRYRFVLPDGLRIPDPASRWQPEDVHGPSEVIDPATHRWQDTDWHGRPWHETVLYELHVGTFTPEGTFRAAIGKLDHLAELGVTAIELMPVSDFPGRWNWGYDGVLPYAPDSAYGRPEDLKALVDAAHAHGLMVFLDVVYNHFGPEGNYLNAYAAAFFTERHHTPWGAAINVDGPDSATVRDFFIHNALYWIEEFHLDGLRFDAVHAIPDDSDKPFLEELAERVAGLTGGKRHVHLVLENDDNASRFLEQTATTPRWYTAQWNDDLHHGLHAAASGEAGGYYADYADDPEKWARALAEGFAFQGDPSAYREGEPRGEPSAHLPATSFVSFLQNHDQIGNRAFGERIGAIAPHAAVRAATAIYLLGPQIPMLFMGEEWAAPQPFPFFADFGGDLADAVREGRRAEFAKFPEFQDPGSRDRIPDPIAEETVRSAVLDWSLRNRPPHADWLAWVRLLLTLRSVEVTPRLANMPGGTGAYEVVGRGGLSVRWRLGDGSTLHLRANLSGTPVPGLAEPPGRLLWTEGDGVRDGALSAWSVIWSIEEPTALDRLAGRMGIETFYTNAAGETVRASPDTVRALLAAMGVDAPDESAAQARLAEIDRTELARALPPVAVLRTDRQPFAVPLALPAGTTELRWTLTLEDGGERSGDVLFADLPLERAADLDGHAVEVRRLDLGDGLPLGYHTLSVEAGTQTATTTVIGVPDRCHLPAPIEMGTPVWGLSAQLYAVRSAADWGIGDFGDLASLAEMAASRGASVIGLNPLHALFLDAPEQCSPYSPASRLFLNPLYIDVTALPELVGCADVRERIASDDFLAARTEARDSDMVDYDAAAGLKLPLLETLFRAFRTDAPAPRRLAFEAFRRERGVSLERFCIFQALRERFDGQGWPQWPEEFRDPASDAVARFAQENAERIDFLAWLQWVADGQLEAAAERARARGMAVGFYRDLAVGADAGGAETWASPDVVVSAAHVGAPPDLFNPAGQDWGLPPFHPQALREQGYADFIELVRANMRHAGALRIDHAMALQHVYWIPEGRSPKDGAYVAYPMDDLIGILALESRRQNCLVVGEDLGTVPDGFRERMTEAGILSYRVVFFEWTDDGGFVGPDGYPFLALATVGSHDLATLRGWWEGNDIELKAAKGLYPAPDEADKQRARRREERSRLIDAVRAAGLPLPASFGAESPYDLTLANAVHAFLARSNAAIAMVQLDELTDEREQINLPGTVDQHPNWRRKLSLTLEELADDGPATALAAIMAAARPAPTGQ